ncbi:hypothetical protein PAI11_06370 [Patulibacter medicamentivorans]|uniref:Uncharacterized protein n=1 Tax=Patulibacter medicamentivorans TaxID=1097667 RepID=H0E1H5_9ACTN|nr:hypothetical protein PAI11_06370 [Patulibacter medicamentivorans]
MGPGRGRVALAVLGSGGAGWAGSGGAGRVGAGWRWPCRGSGGAGRAGLGSVGRCGRAVPGGVRSGGAGSARAGAGRVVPARATAGRGRMADHGTASAADLRGRVEDLRRVGADLVAPAPSEPAGGDARPMPLRRPRPAAPPAATSRDRHLDGAAGPRRRYGVATTTDRQVARRAGVR